MHQGIFVIKRRGSLSCIRSVVEKIEEASWKLEKIGQTIS
jgi:hypothetical protein